MVTPITVTCPSNSSVCIDATPYALTGGAPTGGTYSGTGVSGGIFDPSVAGAGAHVITYMYTNANGCSNSCTYTITVNSLPTASCPADTSVAIDATPFALSGATPIGGTYSGMGVSGGNFNPATAGVGEHTITYTYTDGNGCAAVCTYKITVTPSLTITLTETHVNVLLCSGNSTGSIDLTVSGGTAPFTYAWSNSAITQDLASLLAGTYTVTVTDANGKAVTLQSGEGIAAAPGGLTSVVPRPVDVKAMTEASPLFTEAGLAPLTNAAAIQGVTGAQDIAKNAGISFASEINDVMSGKMDGATALSKTGGMDVPDIDTAEGTSANATPPYTQIAVPAVQSNTNPGLATPI
jgi:hypothetical protein